MKSHELYRDYIKEFGDATYPKAFAVEKEKMLYFLLTHNQNIVVAKSGQKQDEKAFLGYEFSKRRGYEGLRYLPGGTMLVTRHANVSINDTEKKRENQTKRHRPVHSDIEQSAKRHAWA